MKKLLPALIALLVIIGLGTGVIYWRRHHRLINKPWAANPCPNGLASVDNSLQPTLRINLLETNCENDIASVHFNVTNVGTTPLKYFYVRAIYTYDTYVDDGAETGTGPLAVSQSEQGFFGQGTPTNYGQSVGRLHSIVLIPSLLEFPDGTKWRRPSIHEPTSK
ncbi:MAG: hypothetical protein DMF74_04870 [Acidobacteria bacterium]|nr:MAG: hypothetical protein DMF74_04870 [Acidobacteriota bacterium]